MKIAVKCGYTNNRNIVIEYCRRNYPYTLSLDNRSSDCIDLIDGCHCNEKWYLDCGYNIISFEQFCREYLNKPLIYFIW
jgi:hypothetical protein